MWINGNSVSLHCNIYWKTHACRKNHPKKIQGNEIKYVCVSVIYKADSVHLL
jgi:hypothetical protein